MLVPFSGDVAKAAECDWDTVKTAGIETKGKKKITIEWTENNYRIEE